MYDESVVYGRFDKLWSALGTTAHIAHSTIPLTQFMRARYVLWAYANSEQHKLHAAMAVLEHVQASLEHAPPLSPDDRDAYARALWVSLNTQDDVNTYAGRLTVCILASLASLGEHDAKAVLAYTDDVRVDVLRNALDAQCPRPAKKRRHDECTNWCLSYNGCKQSWPLASVLEEFPRAATAPLVRAAVRSERLRGSHMLVKLAKAVPCHFANQDVVDVLFNNLTLQRLSVASHVFRPLDHATLNRLDVGGRLGQLLHMTLPTDPPCTYHCTETRDVISRKATTRKRLLQLIKSIEAPEHCDFARELRGAVEVGLCA